MSHRRPQRELCAHQGGAGLWQRQCTAAHAISAAKATESCSSILKLADVLDGLDAVEEGIPKLPHRRRAQLKDPFGGLMGGFKGASGGRATHDVVERTPSILEPKGAQPM